MTKVKYLLEQLSRMDPEENIANHLWQAEDVFRQAKEMKVGMTGKCAANILDDVDENIDSEYGVSWSTFRDAILDLAPEFQPQIYKFYPFDDRGYDFDDPERTFYFMLEQANDDTAMARGLELLSELGLSNDLPEHCHWMADPLESDDPWLNDDDTWEERYDIVISPITWAINGNGERFVQIVCPHCHKVLESIDYLEEDYTRWFIKDSSLTMYASKKVGESTTKGYECPECNQDITEFVGTFEDELDYE